MPNRCSNLADAEHGTGPRFNGASPKPLLACPKCQTLLDQQPDALVCGTCRESYRLRDGIPSFLTENTLLPGVTAGALDAFVHAVDDVDWTKAQELLPESVRARWAEPRRTDYQAVLPRRRFSRVLELGCGSGAAAIQLTRVSEEVWAIDGSFESLLALRARCKHEDVDGVRPVHATAAQLPFPSGQFDLVVMNGVLERVGSAGRHSDVLRSQQCSLSEAARVLNRNGCLYIGIENRFGGNYLLGAPDEHTGLSYVNVLPRGIANRYSKLVRKREFTAFTHSYRSLQRMLRVAGFEQVQFWAPVPSYREIRLLEPLSEHPTNLVEVVARQFPHRIPPFLVGLSRLVPAQLWRHLAPHFSVVARKQVNPD